MLKTIKKLFVLLFLFVVALFCDSIKFTHSANALTNDYSIDGGRLQINFDNVSDENYFDFYTEYDRNMFVMDGHLYSWPFAEQKAILRNYSYTDVDVSVDLSTINEGGKIEAGIYVQASNVSSNIDGINAWCVCVERNANAKTFNFKLHRFENNKWLGAKSEILGIPYSSDNIHLRIVVKEGRLYAFLNNELRPRIEYYIGQSEGQIGLRSLYSPTLFDNMTIVSNIHTPDKIELSQLINKAIEEINSKNLVDEEAIEEVIQEAQNAQTQKEIDLAIKSINKELENAVEVHTFQELQELLTLIETYSNDGGLVYTENSWSSFEKVRNICLKLTIESTEYDISYWFGRLEAKIVGLIAYKEDV